MYVDDYLIKARRDELKHAAAQSRLAAQSHLAPGPGGRTARALTA